MIEIRELDPADLPGLVQLRVLCWPEELNGLSDQQIDPAQDMEFWTDWIYTAADHSDVRLMIGAFENDQMLGAAMGSLAEAEDIPETGMELNGLWVHPDCRGRGLSLALISTVLEFFRPLNLQRMVIYNFHFSTSNAFYRKLGCRVMRQDVQMKENIPVDVFTVEVDEFLRLLEKKLEKYPLQLQTLPFPRASENVRVYIRSVHS